MIEQLTRELNNHIAYVMSVNGVDDGDEIVVLVDEEIYAELQKGIYNEKNYAPQIGLIDGQVVFVGSIGIVRIESYILKRDPFIIAPNFAESKKPSNNPAAAGEDDLGKVE